MSEKLKAAVLELVKGARNLVVDDAKEINNGKADLPKHKRLQDLLNQIIDELESEE